MTGKERFDRAVSHQKVDRPPMDFWAEEPETARLLEYLGYDDIGRFLDEMDMDIRGVPSSIPPPEQYLGDGIYRDHLGETYAYSEYPPYGKMREHVPGPLSTASSFEDIKAFRLPDISELDYSKLRKQCDDVRGKGCAVRYGWGDVWQRPSVVRGMENTYIDMYDHPEWTLHLSRLFTDYYKAEYTRAWEESGGQIDMFIVISDLGAQNGPLMSLEMFRKFVKPFLQEMTDTIHHLGSHIMFHCCGEMSTFLPDLAKMGVDLLDPIQPAGEKMAPENLAKFKNDICFHGGIDMQYLLPNGTPEEIKAMARHYFEILGPGYILSPAHFFQPNVPPENVVALYQAFTGI